MTTRTRQMRRFVRPVGSARRWAGALLLALAAAAAAQTATKVTLVGTRDFPTLKVSGFAQYYKGDRCGSTGCIEVDGDKTGFQFGAAQATFSGVTYVYDITLYTCNDANGLCTYKMDVDGKSVGTPFTQTSYKEGSITPTTWKKVLVTRGDVIQVMSNGSDSHKDPGGKGPNGYHMAHGRWTKVELTPVSPPTRTAEPASNRAPTPPRLRRTAVLSVTPDGSRVCRVLIGNYTLRGVRAQITTAATMRATHNRIDVSRE